MHEGGFFYQAFVYLLAAVLSVPIAKRLGLGSVLGYLIAGAVIGPYVLGLVGDEGQDVMHFAEFGVVMMLFLVGLELRPSLLWRMRGPILGMGGSQVVVTTIALGAIAVAAGLTWQAALAIGMTLALSSTAIVLQSLSEKGLMKTEGGQSCFAVLLFQDIAVIPMLALLPMLGTGADAGAHGHDTWMSHLSGWQQALIIFGLIGLIVVAGKTVIRPIFRIIAETRLREIFTATALLLVIGIALAMTQVGLSPALGTFLAGVVLAESEYRHALEGDIEPFKGLLLGLFFIAVGASIDFDLLGAEPLLIAALVAALIVVKLVILVTIGRLFRMAWSQNFLFTFSLAQGGEFGFVLFSYASQNGVLESDTVNPLILATALSMAITPLLMILNEKLIQPRFASSGSGRETDSIDEQNEVLIAGFGRFGNVVGRLLKANGIGTTVLDLDPDHIEAVRHFGQKVFYGDAGRMDLLHAAGAEEARVLIIAVDDQEKVTTIAEEARRHFPHLRILARAHSLEHAYELMHLGIDDVYRETMDGALELGAGAMRALGFRAFQAHRAARTFRQHEEKSRHELFEHREDQERYAARVRERTSELENLFRADERDDSELADHAWEPASRPDA